MAKKNPARAAVLGVFYVVFLVVLLEISLSTVYEFYSLHSTQNSLGAAETDGVEPRKIRRDPLGQITCDRSHSTYDLCSINGPTALDPRASTFHHVGPTSATSSPTVEKIRAYPRKAENWTMSRIKELTLTSVPMSRPCKIHHKAPAIVFSAGGYTGNIFHDFNDGFIPLFITVNSIFPDQDVVLVVSKARDWWVSKYAKILRAFSEHPIVDLDNDNSTHCFTSATLGLVSHGLMTMDPNPTTNSKSFIDFHYFLVKVFSRIPNPTRLSKSRPVRPRLILVGRTGTIGRLLLNQMETIRVAEETGFDVIVFEPTVKTRLNDAYALANSSHAMMGVHGAALTHLLFLRPGSVFAQVVPLGLEWASEVCYEKPATSMGLQYMEYRIGVEESSLGDKYGREDLVIKDPVGFRGFNWSNMNVYLKEQDVKLDLVRFRDVLKEMYEKAKAFMDMEG